MKYVDTVQGAFVCGFRLESRGENGRPVDEVSAFLTNWCPVKRTRKHACALRMETKTTLDQTKKKNVSD